MGRGRPARKNKCGQDARAPQRKRPERRPRIRERGCLARQARSAGVPPAKTNAGKMPALHRGIGLNAVRESGSAGVPPAKTNAGKMPALHRGSGLKAVRESGSAGVSPAIHERTEKPRERGLRFTMGSKPRPGVKRRASRPPTADKARQRAFSLGQNTERGRPARNDKCGQDARAPQRKRPKRRHSEKPRQRAFASGVTM